MIHRVERNIKTLATAISRRRNAHCDYCNHPFNRGDLHEHAHIHTRLWILDREVLLVVVELGDLAVT